MKNIVAALLGLLSPCVATAQTFDVYPLKTEGERVEVVREKDGYNHLVYQSNEGRRSHIHRFGTFPLQSVLMESPGLNYFVCTVGGLAAGTQPLFFKRIDGRFVQVKGEIDHAFSSVAIHNHFVKAAKTGAVTLPQGVVTTDIVRVYTRLHNWKSDHEALLRLTAEAWKYSAEKKANMRYLIRIEITVNLKAGELAYAKDRQIPAVAGSQILSAFSEYKGSATGFLISDDGLIATNAHIASADIQKAIVEYDGASYATYPGNKDAGLIDVKDDIFLFRIRTPVPTPYLSLADSGKVELGDKCFTIGYPSTGVLGFNRKFTEGSISSLSGIKDSPRDFQISVPIQPGNSGGPLVDAETARLIGITSGTTNDLATLVRRGDIFDSINYAIKANVLMRFVKRNSIVLPKPQPLPANRREAIDRVKSATVRIRLYGQN